MTRSQQSINRTAAVSGYGYWSGLEVTVEFRPAPPNSGLVFVRRDLAGTPRIPARVAYRSDVPRRTVLAHGGVSVDMVEHVLAALSGLRIDNCEIWVDRAEMPGCDGSSQPFVEALLGARIVRQDVDRQQLIISEPIRVDDGQGWIQADPDFGQLTIQYELDYPAHPVIGRQSFGVQLSPRSFVEQLASARTFLVQHEAQWLREQGFGLRVRYEDLLVFDEHGPILNQLRYVDECARHKTLDVVGDLALAGADIVGRITAHRSGHHLNAQLVRQLLARSGTALPLLKSA
jgi:UDP-3-O-acyl N-acetylglucosamine deacetylase